MKVVATTRQAQGTSASRRLRHENKVPGILYGGDGQPTLIEVDHNPLFHSLRREKFHASILEMELDGKDEKVLLRDFQMHPYRPIVMHVDFQRVSAGKPVHVRVPLHFIGQEDSPAVKVSAAIVGHVLQEVDILCLPKDLPEYIEVDLSNLTAQDTVKVRDLKMPAGVKPKLKGKENPVVVSVTIPGAHVEEEVVAAETVAVAEVPATAQKAPAEAAAAPAEKKEKGGEKKK
jgi:large subunit ribosomal protein L25